MPAMPRLIFTFAAACAALGSAPALAQAGNFMLVNGTGQAMSDVSIRRFGTEDWRPLGVAPGAGARAPVNFSSPDCAFDIRAELSSRTTAIWSGVNLCEVNVLTLHREASGELWVDYD